MPDPEALLSLSQLWDEEEVMTELSAMGTAAPFVAGGPEITMKDIFGEIHPEGQQVEAVPSIIDLEGVPAIEHPTTPVATGLIPETEVPSTRRTSLSSPCHYARLLSQDLLIADGGLGTMLTELSQPPLLCGAVPSAR